MPSNSPDKAVLLSPPAERIFASRPATCRPERLPQRHMIRGLLKTRDLLMIAGGSNTGKSTVVMDMIQRAARDMDWQGLETHAAGVFVCCAEAPAAFEALEDAWLLRHKCEPVPNIFYMEHGFDLDNPKDVDGFIAHVRAQSATYGITFDVLLLETVVDFLGNVEENSNTGLRRINAALTYIAEQLDCAIILVHHFGKDEARGPRGGTALNAKVDARLDCWSEGNHTLLEVKKLRSGPKGRIFAFARESEIVGVDSFGKPTTAGVVVALLDGVPAANAKNNLPLENALLEIVRSSNKPLPWKEVRKRLMSLGFAKSDAERKEAERMRSRLVKSGQLAYDGDNVQAGPKMPAKAIPTMATTTSVVVKSSGNRTLRLPEQIDIEEAIAAAIAAANDDKAPAA